MDPYVATVVGIIILIAIGTLIVWNIYKHRTQEPDINIGDAIGLDLPDNVELGDALGGVLK